MEQPPSKEDVDPSSSVMEQCNSDNKNTNLTLQQPVHHTTFENISVDGSGITNIGHTFIHHQGATINAKIAARTDYTGHYAHNALFPVSTYTKRPSLHRQIEAQLHDRVKNNDPRTQVLVVYGIGGVGKTQLVLNYVYEYRYDYSAVFWIEARSKESVERDYIQIYQLLYNVHSGTGPTAIQLKDAVPAVKRWFHRNQKKWMFVIDSADHISDKKHPQYIDLRFFLPDDPSVHVIITTRDGITKQISTLSPIEVGAMEPNEAVTMFKKQAEMTDTAPQEEAEMLRIVQELGYLALAIVLAGSYISVTPRLRSNISEYLLEYRQRRKELLNQKPDWLLHQYETSVLATWETTFHALEDRCPEACRLLSILSFLHGDDVFMDFSALAGGDEPPFWIRVVSPSRLDQYKLERLLVELRNLSFVTYRVDQKSYTMHRLVQVWAFDREDTDGQRTYSLAVASLLDEIINSMQEADPVLKTRLIPHLLATFDRFETVFRLSIPDDGISYHIQNTTSFLDSCGRWNDVAWLERFLLTKATLKYGKDHPDTISAMNNLASTLGEVGELQQALSMKREVLERRRQVLGEDHPDTISAMNNLANTLDKVGELQQALSMEREVLERRRQVQGEDHPNTISAMNNLASTLGEVGELQQALSMKREVLERRRQVLGEDHPDTISAMSNLANTLGEVGELQQALSMKREVLERRRQVQGEDHPNTISAMNNLANTLGEVGELQQALSMKREVLERRRQVLGEDHPNTISAMSNLANTLGEVGELQQALSMECEVLERRRQVLGEDHPNTISAMSNLANTLGEVGELQQALSMECEVLERRRQVLGEDHPNTISAMSNLATTLGEVGELQQALSMEREVLERRRQVLGEDHPNTISAMHNLAISLWQTGQQQQALSLQQETAEKRLRILGASHPHTIRARQSLEIMLNTLRPPITAVKQSSKRARLKNMFSKFKGKSR